ncbi:hypothetical protein IVB18_24415 [Bradyrhizobium sp. 186]|uniref:hypothetical protein n=1 Tax=Bradyrhizobium sp. 186 TaxID=2782654 RepID=UPI0020016C98|nr:hypothetical protein [Bradyrhizobium sp. 186]UPK40768.1 hypothetical protein IVB18_24415 [Bradyrhizobium sp. 186]
MKQAVASEGLDRQRLIELALAWHHLARDRRDGADELIARVTSYRRQGWSIADPRGVLL